MKRGVHNDDLAKRKKLVQAPHTDPVVPTKPDQSSITFLDLPDEIISKILSSVDSKDVIELSSINRRFRSELKATVFARIKMSWYELIQYQTEKELGLHELFQFPSQIRIVDFYSYGEWQVNIFSELHQKFPNLTHLLINSANSSNWLKYRASPFIKQLTLYYEKGHNETQDLKHEPNPKNILKLSTAVSSSPRIFDLTHLHDFGSLTRLSLDSYHFNWSSCDSVDAVTAPSSSLTAAQGLQHLSLLNCTWEYPFTLAQFNLNSTLQTLSIKYTDNHPFILSERFSKFLEEPTGRTTTMANNSGKVIASMQSLESFSLSFSRFTDVTWRKLISIKQLDKFSTEAFPRLQSLDLYGIQMSLESYKWYVKLLAEKFNLHRLKLGVWDTSRDGNASAGVHTSFAAMFIQTLANESDIKFNLEILG